MYKIKSLLRLGLICYLAFLNPACVSNQSKSEDYRVFYQNDKVFRLHHDELMIMRARLDMENLDTSNSSMLPEDQDYTKDFLAINEMMLSPECKGIMVTKILMVEPFDAQRHHHKKAENYHPDKIDEVWHVSSCGMKRLY